MMRFHVASNHWYSSALGSIPRAAPLLQDSGPPESIWFPSWFDCAHPKPNPISTCSYSPFAYLWCYYYSFPSILFFIFSHFIQNDFVSNSLVEPLVAILEKIDTCCRSFRIIYDYFVCSLVCYFSWNSSAFNLNVSSLFIYIKLGITSLKAHSNILSIFMMLAIVPCTIHRI